MLMSMRFNRLLVGGSFSAFTTNELLKRQYLNCESVSTSPLAFQDNLPKITLYQYKICPFCNKVKAYLNYLKVDYDVVEVNPLTKGEISFSKDHKKVPIVKADDKVLVESNQIVNSLTQLLLVKNITDNSKFFPKDSDMWMDWSEKKLAVYLYPNITRSFNESWESFGYANEIPTWSLPMKYTIRVAGSAAMTLANGKIKKKYNIVDERKELNEEIKVWIDAVGGKKFLHGDFITLPDVMVYGVLRSIQGLGAFNFLMDENPKLQTWYTNVAQLVERTTN